MIVFLFFLLLFHGRNSEHVRTLDPKSEDHKFHVELMWFTCTSRRYRCIRNFRINLPFFHHLLSLIYEYVYCSIRYHNFNVHHFIRVAHIAYTVALNLYRECASNGTPIFNWIAYIHLHHFEWIICTISPFECWIAHRSSRNTQCGLHAF